MSLLARLKIQSWLDLYMALTALVLPWQFVQVVTRGVSPFNAANVAIVGLLFIGPHLRQGKIRYVFAGPLLVYLVGSLLGMVNSEVILRNVYTLIQDFYLYIWFCLLVLLLSRRPRALGTLANWWMVSALLVFGVSLAFGLGEDGGRIEFTFRNPNRAASYWLFTFFLAFHPDVVRWVRFAIWPVALIGLMMTGSNSGVLGLVIGVAVFWLARMLAGTHGKPSLLRVAILVAVIVGAVVVEERYAAEDALGAVGRVAGQSVGLDSRIDRSSAVRVQIWTIGMETFRRHPFGIGPGSFVEQIETGLYGDHGLELHSDYVATLVERGIVGVLGLALFLIAIGLVCVRSLRLAAQTDDRRFIAWTSALVAITASYLSFSVAHEVFHHDTLWLSLALLVTNETVLRRWVDWARQVRPLARPSRTLQPATA